MKRKAYLYSETEDYRRGGHKLTSREKSMAKTLDNPKDFKTGKLRKSSRKTYMEDD
jgi:hypothetical protein